MLDYLESTSDHGHLLIATHLHSQSHYNLQMNNPALFQISVSKSDSILAAPKSVSETVSESTSYLISSSSEMSVE